MIWKTKDDPNLVMRHQVKGYIAESKLTADAEEFVYTLQAPDGMLVRRSTDISRERVIELHQNLTSAFCFINGLSTDDIEDA